MTLQAPLKRHCEEGINIGDSTHRESHLRYIHCSCSLPLKGGKTAMLEGESYLSFDQKHPVLCKNSSVHMEQAVRKECHLIYIFAAREGGPLDQQE